MDTKWFGLMKSAKGFTVAKQIGVKVVNEVQKNSPTILTATAVVGVFATVIFAVRETPKAEQKMQNLEEEYQKKFDDGEVETPKVPKVEIVKKVAPVYLPAVLMGAGTITSIIFANTVSMRRQAALASAYSLSEKAFEEYREKTKEVVGEKKEDEIQKKVYKDELAEEDPRLLNVTHTGKGEQLFKELATGRYFRSSITAIGQAENNLNHELLKGMDTYITMNDAFDELGLENVDLGDLLGWSTDDLDRSGEKGMLHFEILDKEGFMMKNGESCFLVRFMPKPIEDYHNWY